ncbi:hypothetical protein Bbelb_337990 [Branchiostoma belcheri]|nr:hypothetical protein Bbelb_337990 [Branchiostoma belcheri]
MPLDPHSNLAPSALTGPSDSRKTPLPSKILTTGMESRDNLTIITSKSAHSASYARPPSSLRMTDTKALGYYLTRGTPWKCSLELHDCRSSSVPSHHSYCRRNLTL